MKCFTLGVPLYNHPSKLQTSSLEIRDRHFNVRSRLYYTKMKMEPNFTLVDKTKIPNTLTILLMQKNLYFIQLRCFSAKQNGCKNSTDTERNTP